MTLNDLIQYFGNSYQFNKKTGMAHCNYIRWKKIGYIPIQTQSKIEEMTNGALKARLEDLKIIKYNVT